MRIALVGFGKMGHMLKETALSRGHDVVLTTDPVALDADFKSDDCAKVAEKCRDLNVQGIIEFTHPSVVVSNISALVPTGIPLVVGTTGWDSSLDKVKAMVKECGSSFLYSSNFSIGVNIFSRKLIEDNKDGFVRHSSHRVARAIYYWFRKEHKQDKTVFFTSHRDTEKQGCNIQ